MHLPSARRSGFSGVRVGDMASVDHRTLPSTDCKRSPIGFPDPLTMTMPDPRLGGYPRCKPRAPEAVCLSEPIKPPPAFPPVRTERISDASGFELPPTPINLTPSEPVTGDVSVGVGKMLCPIWRPLPPRNRRPRPRPRPRMRHLPGPINTLS
ncbi:hypothetical protein MAR_022216 [Mya arenaria]|uniref:Uncharacterized protein n=1 Tax=Mya arenaria TaxID=6604 RepID=A0ABY7DP38_MYAAR|nr:hypothetical protein MAR_022216 [Mya arenaria]